MGLLLFTGTIGKLRWFLGRAFKDDVPKPRDLQKGEVTTIRSRRLPLQSAILWPLRIQFLFGGEESHQHIRRQAPTPNTETSVSAAAASAVTSATTSENYRRFLSRDRERVAGFEQLASNQRPVHAVSFGM